MLSFNAPQPVRLCDGVSRREALTVGSLGAMGLTLPSLLQARETNPPRKPRSVILLFLLGAPPQQETWDPKPDSPLEARGDLGVIQTATPGLLIGETMTRTARLTEKIAILRAVSTGDNAHSSSGFYMTTGQPHQPQGVENAKPGAPNDWPSIGGVVRHLFEGRSRAEMGQPLTTGVPHAPMQVENAKPGAPNDWPSVGGVVRKLLQPRCKLPAAVTLPEQSANDGGLTWPGQDAGFLGRAADPWLITCEPEKPAFDVPGLALPADVPAPRFDGRKGLLSALDRYPTADPHTRRAFEMITAPAARQAFDLDTEPTRVRDRYGRSRFGQSCLLARRLVEAGVPLVRVNWTRLPNCPNNGHWDTHQKNSEAMRKMMPTLDAAYTALLEDLSDRGMLDDTLVVWMAEFGRTPKINGAGGRDHWGPVFSVALSGGGVKGGSIYGASDKLAAYPKDGRVTPQDLHATLYHCLGIPRSAEIHDSLGRPLAVYRGEPVRQILA